MAKLSAARGEDAGEARSTNCHVTRLKPHPNPTPTSTSTPKRVYMAQRRRFLQFEDEGGPSNRPNPNPNPNLKRVKLDFNPQTPPAHKPEDDQDSNSDSEEEREATPEDESDGEMVLSEEEEGDEPVSSDDDDDDDDDDGDVPSAAASVGEAEECYVMSLSEPDVLDCPICLEFLTIPVFQCENGHIACSSCSTKVKKRCPSCTLPIGHIRCRAIERVVDSVKVSCRNSKYGCMEKTNHRDRKLHETKCAYAPCTCPQLCCTFTGSLPKLLEHFTSEHLNMATHFHFDTYFSVKLDANQKYAIMREKDGQLFILHRQKYEPIGSFVTASCIQPSTSKEKFSYNVNVRKDGSVVFFGSVADNVPARVENPDPKKFLVVPRDFFDPSGKLEIRVNISRPNTTPSFNENPVRR